MRHMDEGRLQAWLDGARAGLSEEERAEVEAHLAVCPDCVARVEALRRQTREAEALLAWTDEEDIPAFDDIVSRAAALRGETVPEPGPVAGSGDAPAADTSGGAAAPPRRGFRPSTLSWAASILVALGVGWMANEVGGPRPGAGPEAQATEEAFPPAAEEAVSGQAPPETSSPEVELLAPVPTQELRSAQEEPLMRGVRDPERVAEVAELAEAAGMAGALAEEDRAVPDEPEEAALRVTGTVTDAATGRPLPGAQVAVAGTGQGALTDAEGRYTILLPPALDSAALSLEATIIGYREEARPLSPVEPGAASADFALQQTALALDALVVTGAAPEPAGRRARNVLPAAELREDDTGLSWTVMDASEAAILAGFTPRRMPGFTVGEIAVAQVVDATVMRVRQEGSDFGEVTVYQALGAFDLPGAGPEWVTAEAEGGVFLLAPANERPEELRGLLQRAR